MFWGHDQCPSSGFLLKINILLGAVIGKLHVVHVMDQLCYASCNLKCA